MENILKLITIIKDNNNTTTPSLDQNSFPYRICDISLPQCKTGFVYYLMSVRNKEYTYIGECKCIVSKLYDHNSGYNNINVTPVHYRPYAIMGYICGFNGENKELQQYIRNRWKEKRDILIEEGYNDTKDMIKAGKDVINELDESTYQNVISELRFIELFKKYD